MAITLIAKKRELTGKKLASLREGNKIPGVLYGHGIENQNLEFDYNTFEKVYQEAGENTLIDLSIDDAKPIKVLIADFQHDSVSDRFIHIDLQQVRMDEKITANVTLNFIGESRLTKEEEGTVIHNFTELEIKCLPGDLLHEIEVDISKLETFDDIITIKDLNVPENVEILHDEEEVVATIAPPKVEEEPIPVVEETTEGEETKDEDTKGDAKTDEKSEDKKENNEEKK